MKRALLIFMLLGLYSNAQEQLVTATEIEEQKEPCLQTISGEIRDQITNELIPETVVSLTDKDGNPIQTLMAASDATFAFNVECHSTYKLTASKTSYNPQSKIFTTSGDSGIQLETKILLDQGRIDFITDPVEESAANDLAEVDANTDVNTAAIGAAISVEPTLENEAKKVSSEVVADNSSEPTVTPVAVIQKKTNKTAKKAESEKELVLKPVLFDYESSYLNSKAKRELLEVVAVMKKNPNLIIECASYTDAKGSKEYNLWMSERRAKRTVEYILRRGIDPQRISGKGYGEAKLINDCTEGADCTDEQRAVNRRTEFKIVKK